jgi:hypothetical protein
LPGNKQGEAMRDPSRHGRARLDTEETPLLLLRNAGAFFDVTVLAWRKYAKPFKNSNSVKELATNFYVSMIIRLKVIIKANHD